MAVGDDFTVLIQGRVAAKFQRGDKSREEVLNLMAGGEQMSELERDLDSVD
jgi:simple sugar transport system ATP-binding protein